MKQNKLRELTDYELSYIRENVNIIGQKPCARFLNLSTHHVTSNVKKMGLIIDRNMISSNMKRKTNFSQDELNIIQMGNMGSIELSKIFKKSKSGIEKAAKRMGVTLPPNGRDEYEWSDEEDQILLEKYSTTSLKNLALLLNRTTNGITYRSSVLGISKDRKYLQEMRSNNIRKYNADLNFFSKINTHEKAYWLGFLWADGTVVKNQLSLGLDNKDESHIFKFKHRLNSEHPITRVKNTNMSKIVISSYEMVDDLKSHGIIQNKTYNHIDPKINKEFLFSFLLGLFDGDGCIIRPLTFSICVHADMGKWLMENVGNLLERPHLYYRKNKDIKIFSVSNKKDCLFLYQKMYENTEDFLIRKKIKFEDILRAKKVLY